MTIIPLGALADNYIWILLNEQKHTFCCVDPGDASPVLTYALQNGLQLTHILLTHHHNDHVGGVFDLLQTYPNATVFGPVDQRMTGVTHKVRDEDIITLDNHALRVLSTPGHTSTHVCYQEPTKGALFCGDTLFSAGCGRVFDGTMEALHHSINLLKQLPKDTKIYCGHEYTQKNLQFAAHVEPSNQTIRTYLHHLQNKTSLCSLPSTLALEKEINPFMRTHIQEVQSFTKANGVASNDSLSVFRGLREMKDTYQ